MTALVSLCAIGHVGNIVTDSPRANALSQYFRQGVVDALQSDTDTDAQIIVLRCEGRTPIAGADIKEFSKPPQTPALAAQGGSLADIGR